MPTGKVKWFNNAKGYGFILSGESGNSEDLFVHYSSIKMDGYKTLKAGQIVQYDILQGPKGLHAVNISIIETGESDLGDEKNKEEQMGLMSQEVNSVGMTEVNDNIVM